MISLNLSALIFFSPTVYMCAKMCSFLQIYQLFPISIYTGWLEKDVLKDNVVVLFFSENKTNRYYSRYMGLFHILLCEEMLFPLPREKIMTSYL